jgi:hypothetical protein
VAGGEGGASRRRSRPTNAALHVSPGGERAAHQRDVAASDGVPAKLEVQVFGGAVAQGKHERPRGVAVDAMHDEHATVAAGTPLDLGRGARQHGVLLTVAGRMHEHARGFVHDDQVVVEEEEIDRAPLGRAPASRRIRAVLDAIAGADERSRVEHDLPIDEHATELDFALRMGVRGAVSSLHHAAQPSHLIHAMRVAPRRHESGRGATTRW